MKYTNPYFAQVNKNNAPDTDTKRQTLFAHSNNNNRASENFYWGLHNEVYNRPTTK